MAANFAIGHQPPGPGNGPKDAKNVIRFIGDGMGVSEVTAARYYRYGVDGRMSLDKFPYAGLEVVKAGKPVLGLSTPGT